MGLHLHQVPADGEIRIAEVELVANKVIAEQSTTGYNKGLGEYYDRI
jgi:hypothetical protein